MLDNEEFEQRKEAFALAKTYVLPLCETYPPENFIEQIGPSTIISSNGTHIVTAAEQAVNLMITVASWLIKDD